DGAGGGQPLERAPGDAVPGVTQRGSAGREVKGILYQRNLFWRLPAILWHAGVHVDAPPSFHSSHHLSGTVGRLLAGDPSTTRILNARDARLRCASASKAPRLAYRSRAMCGHVSGVV